MALWRPLARGLRALLSRDAADRDVADEVQHYLDQATAAHVARGLSPAEALRAARVELGGAAAVRQSVRESGWEHAVESAAGDVRYALRRLRGAPGFTAVTVLTLALGIGATTAIFSAVNPILFQPLPYPGAGRLVAIVEMARGGGRNAGTFGIYRQLAQRAPSLESIAVLRTWQPTLTGADRPERVGGQRVSASYFQVLGVSPVVGRDFLPSDDRPNGPRVVILADALWRRRFQNDRAIVGRAIKLDDDDYTVIGVMPPRFENVLAPAAELWTPLQYDMSLGQAWGHHLRTVARLRPAVGVEQASRQVALVGRAALDELHPETYDPKTQFAAVPLRDEVTRGVKRALLVIAGAVMLLLAIACVNVTNLLLARGVHQRAEFALRAALGAGQGRLVRQYLTESLVLALLGGAAGMAVATLGVRALLALSPPDLPRAAAIGVDGTAFAFGLAITTLIGVAFGLVPALQAARSDPNAALQHGSSRTVGGHRRIRAALVVAEVALALVLLTSSGLLLRSLQRLFAVPVGFDASHLVTMQTEAVGHRFDDSATTQRFFADALEGVRRVPGVVAAGLTSQLPLSSDDDEYGAHFDATPTQEAATHSSFRYAVSPGYIETMGIPLRSGRAFDERDAASAPLVALISESLAQSRFHGRDPIGQRVRIGASNPYTIVGVVGDVKQLSLGLSESEAVYVPAVQWRFTDRALSLVVRARGDAAALAPAIRQAIWTVDKDQPIVRVATMRALLDASASERRFALLIFEFFALAALVLATAGIYGVLSGSVAERTREIGVRTALGASRRDILRLILGQGLRLTVLGALLGLAGAVAASGAIAAMLYGISRTDPLTYAGVIALMGGVSLLACWVPAWRAARVDPATTLRAE